MNKPTLPSTTVFVCSHGSSDERARLGFAALVERFRHFSTFRVASGTLEFSERLLDEQIASQVLVSHRFVLLPLFLAPGIHVREDLRAALERARQHFPLVNFSQTPTLGEHERMECLLSDQGRQWLSGPDEQSAVVLLAHGSAREEANQLVQDIADDVWENLGGPLVTTAFWKVGPSLRKTLRELSLQSIRRVVIMPYFLFRGSITDRIEHEITRLANEFPKLELHLSDVMGTDDRLLALMQDLVESSLEDTFAIA